MNGPYCFESFTTLMKNVCPYTLFLSSTNIVTNQKTFFFCFISFLQLQSAQPLLFASRQQQEQQQAASAQLDGVSSATITSPQQQSPENNLLGVAFSPSDQVSHVKFSNGEGLKYNF